MNDPSADGENEPKYQSKIVQKYFNNVKENKNNTNIAIPQQKLLLSKEQEQEIVQKYVSEKIE